MDQVEFTEMLTRRQPAQIPQLALLGRLLWSYSTCSGVDRDHVWSGRVVGRAFAAVFVGIGSGSPPIMAVLRLEKAWRGLGNLTELPSTDGARQGGLCSVGFSSSANIPCRALSPNPPMRSGLGVGTRGEGRGTRRSALDSDKWGRWRPLVVVGGADRGPGQRRWGGVGGTACRGRQSRTGPVRLCGAVG